MTIEIRPTQPGEWRTAANTMAAALMSPPYDDEMWERMIPSWEDSTSYSAWEGDRCVGHASQFDVDTVVPGGVRLPTKAVSRVGVSSTHRRRRVATGLLHELVHDADRTGAVMMSLRASEATIYERFGFGLAGDYVTATLDPRRAAPIRGADRTGSFRLLVADEIADVIADLYNRVAFTRPGVITRPRPWIDRYFRNAIEGKTASFVAVHTDDDGVDDGYVHYDASWDDEHVDGPQGKGEVHDLFGATPAVELALWQYLCDVDLVTRWRLDERPVDDAVRWAASDVRAYRVRSIEDEQWVRLVDVGAALAARSYAPLDGTVRIKITDPLLPANDGTWEIDAGGARRTDASADVITDIVGLSAAFLGGTSWHSIAAMGRASGDPERIRVADHLFASTPLPFCGSFF